MIFEEKIALVTCSGHGIGRVISFSCSPAGSMIRGQTILVDGGYVLPIQGINLGETN